MKMIMSTIVALSIASSAAIAGFTTIDERQALPRSGGFEQALPRTSGDDFRTALPRSGGFEQALPRSSGDDFRIALPRSGDILGSDNLTTP